MKKRLVAILLILGLGACTPTPTAAPALPGPTSNIPMAVPSATAKSQNVAPTIPVPPTETIVPATEAAGTLVLQVLAPQDDSVVNAPQVDVIGLAPSEAVVSVNDDILIVGADGRFKTTISLNEGPNLVEVVASDENGNEVSQILTVTYEP
jgi:glucodextranase-like protein